jgi:RNA exonuclease 1
LSNNPTMATGHTKQQEEKILAATTNEAGYKQMAMTTIMSLKKQPVSTGDTDIGLDGEWKDLALVKETANILYEKATEYLVPIDTLRKLEYPLPDLLSLPREKHSDMVGTIHVCDRCKKEYLIKAMLDKTDMDSCIYHPARMKVIKVDGQKEKVYGCCEDAIGSVGCTRGPHVYKDTDLSILHKKIPYFPTPARDPTATTAIQNIVALDCEMGYTTAGMELIRLTAVDQDMNVLLDELVLPSNMIIDLNTHYSGIKTLEGVKYDLVGLRKELFKYVDQDTIIVGHGLENDMNALRIIHTKIIDTVAVSSSSDKKNCCS